jgi:hypothetical protein
MLTDVCLDSLVPMGRGNSLSNKNIACTLTKVRHDWLAYLLFFRGVCWGGGGVFFCAGSPNDDPQRLFAPFRHIGFIVVDPNYSCTHRSSSCTDQLCLNV